jgi:hypothetical protein
MSKERGPLDKLLKLSIMVAVLLAGTGIFYHLVIYLPEVDRARRADAKQEAQAAAARTSVEQCLQAAQLLYDITWASACMAVAIHDKSADGSSECSLPDARAAPINASLGEAEAKCLAEPFSAAARH